MSSSTLTPTALVMWAALIATAAVVAADQVDNARPSALEPGAAPGPVPWVRSGLDTNLPVWGVRGHLVWGLPAGKTPSDGPRGLIRLWFPTLPGGGNDLINFIAVEPIVRGKRGFSELEESGLDSTHGKRLWAQALESDLGNASRLSTLRTLRSGEQELQVRIGVEPFDNGARVELIASQSSNAPDELRLSIRALPDSQPLDYCILTATMGNKARARVLWLATRSTNSLSLYPEHRGTQFAPHRSFPLSDLLARPNGDVLVAITTDELDPGRVEPFPGTGHWRYAGFPVTQYWRKPAGTWRPDLKAVVNARYTYWMSTQPVPGGVAFENFELQERFYQDQQFVFGITPRRPADLGFPAEH